MAFWGTSNAFEITGSRTEEYSRLLLAAKVQLICPWENRAATVFQISKTPYPLEAVAAEYYTPSCPKSINVSVFEEGGSPTDTYSVSYTKAKLDVSYDCKARVFDWTITETCSPLISMRRLPSWGFYWNSDGSPVLDEESPAVLSVQLKIQRQMTNLPNVPSWWTTLAGCVNSNVWMNTISNNWFAAGTLLFTPSSATKQLTVNPDDVDGVWDIAYELLWNPIGWNRFQRPTGIDYMMWNGQPYRMYEEKVFPFN